MQLTLLEETLPNEDAIRLLRAKELLSAMTMEQKMGQLFLVRAPQNAALAWIETYQPGGFILFARDFEDKNPQVLASSTAAYQQASQIPMLIAVDEEGGTVVRISKYSAFRDTSFASPRALYAEGGWQLLKRDTQEKCHLLTSLGINVNLAPVCDLAETPGDYMYQRSFSG
ncbi:MAG: glycoside hydrolase family 3 N-terminal domain-containing protein, partial [Clostridiales bacterium]